MSEALETSEVSQAATEAEERSAKRFEMLCGLTLAVFAATLAITDLGGGKYGDDEIIGTNEKANLYAWYQSKSIKQGVVEGERDLVAALLEGGVIVPESRAALEARVKAASDEIARYKAEKKEILQGSEAVGPAGQVLETNGVKGQVVGTKPLEAQLAVLGAAGDVFDMATLYLQLCLVLGAIALVLQDARMKKGFYAGTVVLGAIGTVYTVRAFLVAMG